ncbi:MAG: hypothetical protein L6R38_007575 [Xanthoria sp. 2 TBL-2021]|nr:MAG: hypothetical protein L6R38_007575 [Xanthoria sp. 2 TBL-2021]
MDPGVIAAIAALVVAFVAFLVASAQAIQQYFVSGQLIRLCDSVVYNQMPGQGHRIWQFSQFRFRVVYSIPQIHLLPDLWLDISTHVRPLPPDAAPLPNLKVQKSNPTSAALAGEASWVSFVRAVQHSAGRSIRYVMVDGDADRCPSDLPVVPMQLSMRDIAVMALSAGMQCTDVSFQSQSISMQGDAGTITCSRHPVLGSLIHFAQKQALEDHGIQVSGGTIQGNWVARMLDIVTVAGHRYDSVERKHYEEDEGSWIKASDNRPILLDQKPASPLVNPPAVTVRRRRPTHSSTTELNHGDPVTENYDQKPSAIPLQSPEKGDPSIIHRPQDGKWTFIPGSANAMAEDTGNLVPPRSARTSGHGSPVQSNDTLKTIQYHFRRARRKTTPRKAETILPISEPIDRPGNDENQRPQHAVTYSTPVAYELKSDFLPSHSHNGLYPGAHHGKLEKTQQGQRVTSQLENGDKQGISQDPNRESSNIQPAEPRTLLLLTDGTTYTGQTSALPGALYSPKRDREVLQDQARHEFVVDKWQETFQQRRKERSRGRSQNDRDRRPASRRRPTRSSNRQDSLDQTQKPNLRESATQKRLAIKERRRTSSSKLSDSDYGVVFGDRQNAKRHTGLLSERGRDRPLPKRKYRKFRSRWNTRRSSSSSVSPTLGAHERPESPYYRAGRLSSASIHGRTPYLGHRAPVERGRRRNSEISTIATGFDDKPPSHLGSTPKAYSSSQAPRVQQKDQMSDTSVERGSRKRVRVLDQPSDDNALVLRRSSPFSPTQEVQPSKPALRSPTERFPEDPDFVRPGVAAPGEKRIPEGARWTKISREIIDPKVLERGRERYVEEVEYVIVLRVLSRLEIQQYAAQTHELRARQKWPALYEDEDLRSEYQRHEGGSEDSDDSHVSFMRQRDLETERSRTAIRDREWQTTRPNNPGGSIKRGTDQSPGKSTSLINDQRHSGEHEIEHLEGRHQQHLFSNTKPNNIETTLDQEASPRRTRREDFEHSFLVNPAERTPSSESTRRQRSIPRHQSLRNEDILTYAEEIMFLQSDHILKRLTACTEQCKDVTTTLQFVRSVQPELGSNVVEVHDLIRDSNTFVKALLVHVEPLRRDNKMADIVNTKLDTLLLSLHSSLDVLQTNFDFFDITPLVSEERQKAWDRTLELFESRHACSMGRYLGMVRSFSAEITSNFQAGIFTSPEADLLMKRLSEATFDRGATPRPAPIPENLHRRGISQSRSRYFHSPSRFTDSPLGSPVNHAFRKPSLYDKVPKYNSRQIPPRRAYGVAGSSVHTSSSYWTDTNDSSSSETDTSSATLASSKSSYTGEMKWFWICQTDVLPGYFATPWKDMFDYAECIGTISVLLTSLEQFTNETNLQYVVTQQQNRQWLRQGKTTYPSYAHNAVGGIVVAGAYKSTTFGSFRNPIAPLELLKYYEHQVDRNFSSSAQAVIDSTAEIMGFDTWLSISGRQPEIENGPSGLLRTLPTLIQQIMTDFHLEFTSLDRTSKDGGSRIIETISDSLLEYLKEQGLDDAERLFCIVALLRTAKMALCVARGTDTAMLRDVLIHDVQVYLA